MRSRFNKSKELRLSPHTHTTRHCNHNYCSNSSENEFLSFSLSFAWHWGTNKNCEKKSVHSLSTVRNVCVLSTVFSLWNFCATEKSKNSNVTHRRPQRSNPHISWGALAKTFFVSLQIYCTSDRCSRRCSKNSSYSFDRWTFATIFALFSETIYLSGSSIRSVQCPFWRAAICILRVMRMAFSRTSHMMRML